MILCDDMDRYYPVTLDFLISQLNAVPQTQQLQEIIDSLLTILKQGTYLPGTLIQKLLQPPFSSLRLHPSHGIFKSTMELYRLVLSGMNEPERHALVSDAAKQILEDTKVHLASLQHALLLSPQHKLNRELDTTVQFSQTNLVSLICFNLLALSTLSGVPSSFIKEVVSVLSTTLHPTRVPLIAPFPKIQLACIQALRTLTTDLVIIR